MNHTKVDSIDGLSMNLQPIFILSYGRSGSTLLRYVVDTHPDITCPGEINLGKLCDSLFHTVYYTTGQLTNNKDKYEWEQTSITKTREIIISLMNEYTRGKEKKIWCERSPLTIDHLPIIYKLFPNAKYICLYRNALDFAHSMLNLNRFITGDVLTPYVHRNPTSVLSAAMEYWIDKSELLMEFEQNYPGQCIRLKYEDFIDNPVEILNSMFDFLKIKWNENILSSVFTSQHDDGPGDVKLQYTNRIRSDTVGKGVAIPYEQIYKPYLSRINHIQETLGYQSVEHFYQSYHNNAIQSAVKAVCDTAYIEKNEAILDFLKEKAANFRSLDSECKLIVSGGNGGMWMCGPQTPNVRVLENDEEAACSIILSYESLMDILNKDQNPMDIYQEGKIRIAGNLEMAERFGQSLLGS
jgi:protein-tyrosine sulfotransferase